MNIIVVGVGVGKIIFMVSYILNWLEKVEDGKIFYVIIYINFVKNKI